MTCMVVWWVVVWWVLYLSCCIHVANRYKIWEVLHGAQAKEDYKSAYIL